MLECFGMESLSDIFYYYCGGGDFGVTFLVYGQYFQYGNTVPHSWSKNGINVSDSTLSFRRFPKGSV